MKKIVLLLAVIGMFSFQGCEGPEGMPGLDGLDGQKGDPGYINQVSEANIDFTSGNGYSATFSFNKNNYSGDNVLIYELVNANDGIDTWALLPQIYYFTGGTAQYNYNFSYDQFSIFIDADFSFTQLPSSFTTDKTFRIVIIPGDDGVNSGGPNSKASVKKEDFSDYNAVIAKYKIDDSNIKKLN